MRVTAIRDLFALTLAGAAALFAGCSSGSGSSSAPAAMTTGVTYQKDIRAVLEANCTGCHFTGGIAPFPLDNWPAVQSAAPGVLADVASGKMPPWLADESCHPLRDSPALSAETKSLFVKWQSDKMPEGNAADYKKPVIKTVDIGPATSVWPMKSSYSTPKNINDNYRCFLLPGTFASDTYITAVNIEPGQSSIVHHVQIHTIPAAGVAQAQMQDGSDGNPGWDCSGTTSIIAGDYNLFSWRPGTQTAVFEPGDAVLVDAGTAVIMQVHYNTQNLKPGQTPPADLSKVSFWTLPEGKLPDRIIRRYGLFGFPLNIPAGDAHYSVVSSYPMSTVSTVGSGFLAGELVGETPHMHHLGTTLSVKMSSPTGAKTCAIDVPHWNFEWQMDYFYAPGTGVPFTENDTLAVECDYNNSAANQPSINGVQLTPTAVSFGEGSYAEMCLSYTWLRYDRNAYLTAMGKM
jgi:hypothetical protein